MSKFSGSSPYTIPLHFMDLNMKCWEVSERVALSFNKYIDFLDLRNLPNTLVEAQCGFHSWAWGRGPARSSIRGPSNAQNCISSAEFNQPWDRPRALHPIFTNAYFSCEILLIYLQDLGMSSGNSCCLLSSLSFLLRSECLGRTRLSHGNLEKNAFLICV